MLLELIIARNADNPPKMTKTYLKAIIEVSYKLLQFKESFFITTVIQFTLNLLYS
jgi:hypothetical protein